MKEREKNVEKKMRAKKRVSDTKGQNCSLGGEMKGKKKKMLQRDEIEGERERERKRVCKTYCKRKR